MYQETKRGGFLGGGSSPLRGREGKGFLYKEGEERTKKKAFDMPMAQRNLCSFARIMAIMTNDNGHTYTDISYSGLV